jgi:hypothetical protein
MAAATAEPTATKPSEADGGLPPMYTDTPLALIPTPLHTTGKTNPFTLEASNMALSHNALIAASTASTRPRRGSSLPSLRVRE